MQENLQAKRESERNNAVDGVGRCGAESAYYALHSIHAAVRGANLAKQKAGEQHAPGLYRLYILSFTGYFPLPDGVSRAYNNANNFSYFIIASSKNRDNCRYAEIIQAIYR